MKSVSSFSSLKLGIYSIRVSAVCFCRREACDSKGIDHSRISKPRTRVPLIQFLSKSTMSASGSAVSKFLKPSLRPKIHPTDVQAAAMWGVAAATAAIWIVQPFDWLKKTLFEKPEPEAK